MGRPSARLLLLLLLLLKPPPPLSSSSSSRLGRPASPEPPLPVPCDSSPCRNGGTCLDLEGGYHCLCPQEPLSFVGRDCETLHDACAALPCPPGWLCSGTPGLLGFSCLCQPGPAAPDCSAGGARCEASPCPQPHWACSETPEGYACQAEPPSAACASQPCLHGGTCSERGGAFACLCPPGHAGPRCEEEAGECASSPCRNGALCLDQPHQHRCFCVPGFQGPHCEIDINECASRPCRHNGTCLNRRDHYACQCPPGYAGVNCEVDIDECASGPCWNGGTCSDHVGLFTCACLPGYEGAQCEVDTDECQSRPCLHGGACWDAVNSYQCDCGGTGFEGLLCELEVLECASQPCQNGATCLEGVGRYSCACWPGYEGEHCEVDVDECAVEPCLNGGRCYERSNQSLYGGLPHFPQAFSYQEAAGFLCSCRPGFEGETCAVDMDECASQPCQNGGSCVDLVNGFQCHCLPGYSGAECATDTDECEGQPCENGGTCEDGLADYTCHCSPGADGTAWGGKNCSVALTGCQAHPCQNQAACSPTYQAQTHGHRCHCQPGFHGPTCALPTAFSLRPGARLFLSLPTHSESASDGLLRVALRFRTTLPEALLLCRGRGPEHLCLELLGGRLRATLTLPGGTSASRLEEPRLDDGHWHQAEMLLRGALELRLWHEACPAGVCLRSCPLPGETVLPPSFGQVHVGGLEGELPGAPRRSFAGCLEDLQVDATLLLPQELPPAQAAGIQLGCERTDWCRSQPCLHGGRCLDRWADFRCRCPRPYEGRTCAEESPPGTFGQENSSSAALFALGHSPGPNVSLSFFLRTRRPRGLLLQVGHGSEALLSLFLEEGRLRVQAPPAQLLSASGRLDDGRRRLVTLTLQGGAARAAHLPGEEQLLGPLAVPPLAAGAEVRVGGLPGQDADPWGGPFKGCLQDLRLGQHRLRLFPLGAGDDHEGGSVGAAAEEEEEEEETGAAHTTNVLAGCVSDDSCKPGPCLHGGLCTVTWNDFECRCPANFTGKRCQERVWCPGEPCPPATTCRDVPSGYVCLANATFFERDAVEFSANASVSRGLHRLRLDFRTRDEEATLLRAVRGPDSLLLAVQNASLLVELRSGSGEGGAGLRSPAPVADGSWHSLELAMEEPWALSSRWRLGLDGSSATPLQGRAGTLDFLKAGALLVLAENFTGCLGHVDVGGVPLPLAPHAAYPQAEQFLQAGRGALLLGCRGADVCASGPCLHAGTCQDRFNAFGCSCAAGWEGPLCQRERDECASSPCLHGECLGGPGGFRCRCHKGYIGRRCHIDVDDCIRHQCQHGGSCVDGVYGYSCLCPPDRTGPHCEWPFPLEQCGHNFTCLNGGRCLRGAWGANCTCQPGYTGRRCQVNINDCDPNPCQNGGTCQDAVNRYRCVCSASFTGERCDVDRPAWAQVSSSSLVGAVGAAGAAVLVTVFGVSVVAMKKRRATQGTYSPSRQEKDGARVEMWNVIKLPPLERLI